MMNYAAKFGQTVDRGMRGVPQAFPYIYNLINQDQDQWEQVKNPTSLGLNLSGLGPLVAAGTSVRVPVILDADYNFKLLYLRYTAYGYGDINVSPDPFPPVPVPPPPMVNAFFWHEPLPGMWVDLANTLDSLHDSILRNVRVTVAFQTNGQNLYGAPWQSQTPPPPFAGMRNPLPLPVIAVQGNEFAIEPARLPMLLPANGAIMYEIYNDNAFDVVVGITAHGMKVRL
jgi:hypothetical protein